RSDLVSTRIRRGWITSPPRKRVSARDPATHVAPPTTLPGGRRTDVTRVAAGFACLLAALLVGGTARAALLVYEPFDYAPGTVLDGVLATGANLAGDWTPLGTLEAQKLVVTSPGLDYGNLVGAPPALGNRTQDANGVTAAAGTVALASPVLAPPGSTLYWSALLLLDDSNNG